MKQKPSLDDIAEELLLPEMGVLEERHYNDRHFGETYHLLNLQEARGDFYQEYEQQRFDWDDSW